MWEVADEADGVGEDDFSTCEVTYVPTGDTVKVNDEDKAKLEKLIEDMDEVEDVQAVYHNAEL